MIDMQISSQNNIFKQTVKDYTDTIYTAKFIPLDWIICNNLSSPYNKRESNILDC